jgi:hypothetical protein
MDYWGLYRRFLIICDVSKGTIFYKLLFGMLLSETYQRVHLDYYFIIVVVVVVVWNSIT